MRTRLLAASTAFVIPTLASLPAVALPLGWNGMGYQSGLYGVGGATTPSNSIGPWTLSTSPTPFIHSFVAFHPDEDFTLEELGYLGVTYTDLGLPGGQLPSLLVALVGGKCSQIKNVSSGINLLTGPFNNSICGTGGGTADSYATTIATLGSYDISGFSFVLGGGLPSTAQTLVLESIDVGLAVPEPESITILVAGLVSLYFLRLRKRRRVVK